MECVYCAVQSEPSNTVLSCRPVIAEAEVRFQASLFEICGRHSGTMIFIGVLQLCFVCTIAPMIHSLSSKCSSYEKDIHAKPGNFQESSAFP